jgi:cobalamin biosynthesis protein CobD/CbiB
VALNCCVLPIATLAVAGETAMPVIFFGEPVLLLEVTAVPHPMQAIKRMIEATNENWTRQLRKLIGSPEVSRR